MRTLQSAEEIRAAVKKKMDSRKENPADVARYLGRNYQQIWEWINGKKGTQRLENLQLLQTYLDLPDRRAGFK